MAKEIDKIQKMIFICNGDCCMKNGADENTLALRESLKEHQLNDEIHTVRTKCFGQCKQGPIMFIHPENVWYKEMDEKLSKEIVTSHILKDEFLDKNILFDGTTKSNLKITELPQ